MVTYPKVAVSAWPTSQATARQPTTMNLKRLSHSGFKQDEYFISQNAYLKGLLHTKFKNKMYGKLFEPSIQNMA